MASGPLTPEAGTDSFLPPSTRTAAVNVQMLEKRELAFLSSELTCSWIFESSPAEEGGTGKLAMSFAIFSNRLLTEPLQPARSLATSAPAAVQTFSSALLNLSMSGFDIFLSFR